jgi:hypothetical protein
MRALAAVIEPATAIHRIQSNASAANRIMCEGSSSASIAKRSGSTVTVDG